MGTLVVVTTTNEVNMKGVPFSIRLPQSLFALIERHTKNGGIKSNPDIIRAGLEQTFASPYRVQVLEATTNPEKTLELVREHIQNDTQDNIPMAAYSALMNFWHHAYMTSDGYATPSYVLTLLGITHDLILLAQEQGIYVDEPFLRSRLGIKDEESIPEGIGRVFGEFESNPSVSYAEVLTRPIEILSDKLQHFLPGDIHSIFRERVEELLPVAVAGANRGKKTPFTHRADKSSLPDDYTFTVGEVTFSLEPLLFCLLVAEGHHTYAFGTDSLLSLKTGIDNHAFTQVFRDENSFVRGDFKVERCSQKVFMHANDNYRLRLSDDEFKEFCDHINTAFSDEKWKQLEERIREMRGDI